jgi:pimeloyl-ACP methyl ester carboxylesterase
MSHITPVPGQPTVVLVHGAFADASIWTGVIERLQARGIQGDGHRQPTSRPIERLGVSRKRHRPDAGPGILVGHSYAGAMISNAAARADDVVGLVFVAAFAPDEGEVLGEVSATSSDSILMSALVPHAYPTANGGTGTEFAADPVKFRDTFAADLPAELASVLAATQRPVADAAFSDPAGKPAWRDLPSWAVVATADKAAGTDIVQSMARRANATITEIKSSHLIMVSQPQAVTDVIVAAVDASTTAPVA